MNNTMVLILCLSFLAFIALMVIDSRLDKLATLDSMQVCVEAGGEWIRDDFSNYFECVRN